MIKKIILSLTFFVLTGTSFAHAGCDSDAFREDVLQDLRALPEFNDAKTAILAIHSPKTIIYNETYNQYRCRYTVDLQSGKRKELSIEYKPTSSEDLSFSYEEITVHQAALK